MKILDTFSAYRLAYGNPLLHAGFFIAIIVLNKETPCQTDNSDYKIARSILMASHVTIVVLQMAAFLIELLKKKQTQEEQDLKIAESLRKSQSLSRSQRSMTLASLSKKTTDASGDRWSLLAKSCDAISLLLY